MKKCLCYTITTIIFIIVFAYFIHGYMNHELITDPPSGPLKWWSNILAFWIVFSSLAMLVVIGLGFLTTPVLPGDPAISIIAFLLFIVFGGIGFVLSARGWAITITLNMAQATILYLLCLRYIKYS